MSKLKIAAGALVLLSSDEIKLDQDGIKKDMGTLDARIHANAVQCLAHAAKHGDTSLMTRLLTDTISADSGYRRQGLIQAIRRHSPMELKGNNIDLSGFIMSDAQRKLMIAEFPDVDEKLFVVGERRPFLVEQFRVANWKTNAGSKEQTKPLFQATLMSGFDSLVKKFTVAAENTANGEPIDPSKPFFDGKNMDAVQTFLETVKSAKANLPADLTHEIRERQQRRKEDDQFLASVGADNLEVVKATGTNG